MSGDKPESGLVPLLTISQAAESLGMCEKTLRGYMRLGEVKHIAFGHGLKRQRRMFHPDDLAAFVDRQRRSAMSDFDRPGTFRVSPRSSAKATLNAGQPIGFLARMGAEKAEREKERAERKAAKSPSPKKSPRG